MRILKFEQDNCQPCTKVNMFCDMVLNEKPDEIINLSRGDEDSIELASKFGIMSVPVLILLDDEGNEVERIIGFDDKQEKIIEMFDKRG